MTSSAGRRALEASDRARADLARRLHATTQQHLVNAYIHLGRVNQLSPELDDETREALQAAADEAKAGIDGMRELVADLHPTVLDTHGLAAALDHLATRVTFPLTVDDTSGGIDDPWRTHLYAVCVDALAAISRTERVEVASVAIQRDGDVRLTIDVRTAPGDPRPAGWAASVDDRVELLDGRVELDAAPGRTVLSVRLPLP